MDADEKLPLAPPAPFESSSPVLPAGTASCPRAGGIKTEYSTAPGAAVVSGGAPPPAGEDGLVLLPEVQAKGRPAGSKRPFQRRRRSRACDACRARKTKCDTPDHGPCSACKGASLICKFSEGEDKRRAGPARRVRALEATIQDLTQRLAEAEQRLQGTGSSVASSSRITGVFQSPIAETDTSQGLASESPSLGSPDAEFPRGSSVEGDSLYLTRHHTPPRKTPARGGLPRSEQEKNKGRFQPDGTAWDDHMFGPSSGPSFLNSYKEYLSRLGYRPPSAGDPHDYLETTGRPSSLASCDLSFQVRRDFSSTIPGRFAPLDLRAFLPPPALARELLEVFRKTVQNYTPMFYWPTIEGKFERAWDSPIWDGDSEAVRSVFCVVVMLLAVGSQFVEPGLLQSPPEGGDWSNEQERNGWIFFEFGKKYANLNNPSYSIDDAIYLLLMAFYLDKAFLPSPCWMFTGSMARVCQDIGLYRRTPSGMYNQVEVESRTRLFWAAYIQDRKISMKQGRPVIFLDKHIDVGMPGEHVSDGIGSSEGDGDGDDRDITQKSLQIFRATVLVSKTSEPLLNISLKDNGGEGDIQVLQEVDEMLKRSWESFPPELTDLQEVGPLAPPAVRPLFHLQHSRIVLYRYFTDFSSTPSLIHEFRTFCLGQSIQVSKITAHLLLRAAKSPDFDDRFGLASDELVHIHTFRAATILLLGYYCRDRNLLSVSKGEVDICIRALRSIAKSNHQTGEKMLQLFKDFAMMFGYSIAPEDKSPDSSAAQGGLGAPGPRDVRWGAPPTASGGQSRSQLPPVTPIPRFCVGGAYSSTAFQPPQPSPAQIPPTWLQDPSSAGVPPPPLFIAGGGTPGVYLDPQIAAGTAPPEELNQIDWNVYQQMMQFDPGFAKYMLGPNDRDFQ